jgi:membrane-associated phospholipid phosphatase
MPVVFRMLMIVLAFAAAGALTYRHTEPLGLRTVFGRLWPNLGQSLLGKNPLYWLAAVLITAVMVASGWDRTLQDFFQATDILSRDTAWWVLRVGEFWTLVVALLMYLAALVWKRRALMGGAVAALQAVLATFVATLVLKGLAGRRGPARPGYSALHASFPKTRDPSDFLLEFWRNHIHDGRFFWPSGHTATAMTLVSALVAFYPERRWLAWVGYPVVAFVGLGLVEGDFHWVSDIFAGALIGHVIGWTVGTRIRRLSAGASPGPA